MKITEPATMLTDYALAAVAITLGVRLWGPEWQSTPITLWAAGFFATAAAAATGGTFHGFRNAFSENALISLWNVTVFLIGLASGLMIAGAATAPIGWSDPATVWFIAGLAASVTGLVVQQSSWQLHRHFNHNDISHLIHIVALISFYIGATSVMRND